MPLNQAAPQTAFGKSKTSPRIVLWRAPWSNLRMNAPELAVIESITITRTELSADASRVLINALNAELSGAYPEPGATHFGLEPEDVAIGRGAFLVVHRGGIPVGCGAVRLIDPFTAEVKRMYVSPSSRGRGLGKRLVAALEAEARTLGARQLVLETGIRQQAALALYRSSGFQRIPLYGEYCLSPDTSICLGKELAG
jgi:GNAT superfamily N-acetyltransferase